MTAVDPRISKRHLHKLGIIDNVFCRLCGAEEETLRHILMKCDVVMVTRERSFGQHQISLEDARSSLDPGLLVAITVGRLGLNLLRKRKGAQYIFRSQCINYPWKQKMNI